MYKTAKETHKITFLLKLMNQNNSNWNQNYNNKKIKNYIEIL